VTVSGAICENGISPRPNFVGKFPLDNCHWFRPCERNFDLQLNTWQTSDREVSHHVPRHPIPLQQQQQTHPPWPKSQIATTTTTTTNLSGQGLLECYQKKRKMEGEKDRKEINDTKRETTFPLSAAGWRRSTDARATSAASMG